MITFANSNFVLLPLFEDKKEESEKSNNGSKTKLQLAIEAAEFLYEHGKWRT